MKKFFGFLVLCVVVGSAFGMKRLRPDEGSADEGAPVAKRQKLSSEMKKTLNDELGGMLLDARLHGFSPVILNLIYDHAVDLLDRGADPDARYNEDTLLGIAIDIKCSQENKFVDLLLSKGAHPNDIDKEGALLPRARNPYVIRTLVHAGADINVLNRYLGYIETALINLCSLKHSRQYLPTIIWLLHNGANPNIGPNKDENGSFAIHHALFGYELEIAVALLQGGARLDVCAVNHEQPLAYAKRMLQTDCGTHAVKENRGPRARAQYELLKAVDERALDPHRVYEIDEYVAMGISYDSAQRIMAATREVNKIIPSALGDDKYEHGE